jgi:hypothetical protein
VLGATERTFLDFRSLFPPRILHTRLLRVIKGYIREKRLTYRSNYMCTCSSLRLPCYFVCVFECCWILLPLNEIREDDCCQRASPQPTTLLTTGKPKSNKNNNRSELNPTVLCCLCHRPYVNAGTVDVTLNKFSYFCKRKKALSDTHNQVAGHGGRVTLTQPKPKLWWWLLFHFSSCFFFLFHLYVLFRWIRFDAHKKFKF